MSTYEARLGITAAAKRFGVTRRTINRWVEAGLLPKPSHRSFFWNSTVEFHGSREMMAFLLLRLDELANKRSWQEWYDLRRTQMRALVDASERQRIIIQTRNAHARARPQPGAADSPPCQPSCNFPDGAANGEDALDTPPDQTPDNSPPADQPSSDSDR